MELAFLSPSPMELAVIAVIALLVLGPARLPEAAKALGKGMKEMRDSFSGAMGNDDDRADDDLDLDEEDDEDDDMFAPGDEIDEDPDLDTAETEPIATADPEPSSETAPEPSSETAPSAVKNA